MPPISVPVPDALAIASDDGLRKAGGMLGVMGPDQLVMTIPEFAGVDTEAEVVVLDPAGFDGRLPKAQLALALLTGVAVRTGVIPIEALRAAGAGPFEAENLNAIDAGVALAG
jgi:hypothetical protein